MEQQDNRHIPQSSGQPHNVHTRPAEDGDKDKLRENPHNDERIITQQDKSQESNPDLRSGSTFAQKDDEGMNRVTNEQEQNQVVNPQEEKRKVVNVAKKDDDDDDDDDDEKENPETDPQRPAKPEIPAEPDFPTENPYEQIGDDPDEMDKKIPRF